MTSNAVRHMLLKCIRPGCTRTIFHGALCRTHYRRAHTVCLVPGCDNPFFCRYVCEHHYRAGVDVEAPVCECGRPVFVRDRCIRCFVGNQCIVEDCEEPRRARGMCMRHYMRVYRSHPRSSSPEKWSHFDEMAMPTTPENMIPAPNATHQVPESHVFASHIDDTFHA